MNESFVSKIRKINDGDYVRISNPGCPTDNKVGIARHANPYKMTAQVRYLSNNHIKVYQENKIKFDRLTVISEKEYNDEIEKWQRTTPIHYISENDYPEKSKKLIIVFTKLPDDNSDTTKFRADYGYFNGENFVDNESNIIHDVVSWQSWKDSVKDFEKILTKDFIFRKTLENNKKKKYVED